MNYDEMENDLKILGSAEETASALADELAGLINRSVQDRPFSMALSGGSTPKLLFQSLAAGTGTLLTGEKLIFSGLMKDVCRLMILKAITV